MRKLVVFIIIAIFFYGCNTEEGNKKEHIVSVSIIPQQYFIDYLSDSSILVNVMIPPGAGHSTYEPLPSQMKYLNMSEIYFKIGHLDFEHAWVNRFANSNKTMKIIDLSVGINLHTAENTKQTSSDKHHNHGHHHHSSIDPHIWLNPDMVKTMIPKITNELSSLLPEKKELFSIRAQQLMHDIDSLDNYICNQFEGVTNRKFLIFHPALTWYANRYGLEQISVEVDGKEPSPSEMKEIIKTIKENNIKVILIQSEFPFERARSISEETGADIVQINPLSYDWLNNMYKITSVIKQSLSK